MRRTRTTGIDRRRFLALVGWVPLATPTLFALAGCGRGDDPATPARPDAPAGDAASEKAAPTRPQPAPPSTAAPPADTPESAASAPSTAETGASDGRLVTEVAAMQPMVQALEYTNETSEPDQRCANCRFYTPQGDTGRGQCQLFAKGLVTAEGWCTSWQPRPEAA